MSEPRRLTHSRAVVYAVVVTFLWSSSWILIRWGLDDEALDPVGFAGLRYGVAAMMLLAWVISRPAARAQMRHIDKTSFIQVAALGLVFYGITQGAQFIAIDSQPAATTSLVLSWTPLAVALAGFTIAEGFTVRQLIGSLLVVAGAWSYFSGELGATAVGMIAAICGLGANVVSALLGRNVNRSGRLTATVVTALSMAVGAIMLICAALVVEGVPTVSPRAWLIILWLAAVNTALAFTLWNLSLQRLSALESAAINNTMLIQIALLAWVFLDEPLGWTEVAGILLATLGIVLAQGLGATGSLVRPRPHVDRQ